MRASSILTCTNHKEVTTYASEVPIYDENNNRNIPIGPTKLLLILTIKILHIRFNLAQLFVHRWISFKPLI